MIPRKIHFVWLGSALPDLYRNLIQRCRRLHPGWRIHLWEEEQVRKLMRQMGTGLDARMRQPELSPSTRSDLARYHIIAQEGGIYLDTDFLVLRSFEPLRQHSLFGVYQQPRLVCSGVFGAAPGHPVFPRIFKHLLHTDYTQPPHQLAGPHMFSPFCRKAVAADKNAALLPRSTFLPVHYEEKHDLTHWLSQDLRRAYAVHLWAHSLGPGGGDGTGELFSRIGAILLNPTYPAKGRQ